MDDFVIRSWSLEPFDGDQAPLHVHDEGEEAFVCINGDLEVVIDNSVQRVEPGRFVVVPHGETHTFRSRRGAEVVAVMSPEIAELIDGLHERMTEEERAALWQRCRSRLVGSE